MKTLYIKNVPTTKTSLDEGSKLCSLYVTNTTASNVTFSLLIEDTYFIKDASIVPGTTLQLIGESEDCKIYHALKYVYVQAGTADALDVVYTSE